MTLDLLNQKLIHQISDFFAQAKKSHALIALSGGIDSAYSAMLHVAALGKDNVILLNLPSRHNSSLTKDIAAQVAHNLGCLYLIIPIQAMVDEVNLSLDAIAPQFPWPVINPRDENTQARTRANVIASLANKYDALFPCNANKSELVIGYGTLYGDISGYACPFGSLWKSEVFTQAKLLSQHLGDILPMEIFTTHPSAELGEHQDVTKNLGDPMVDPYHEKLLRFWSEHDGQTDFYSQTVASAKSEQLDELIRLTPAEKKVMLDLCPTLDVLLEDLAYFWGLFTGPGQFKKAQAPPVFSLL